MLYRINLLICNYLMLEIIILVDSFIVFNKFFSIVIATNQSVRWKCDESSVIRVMSHHWWQCDTQMQCADSQWVKRKEVATLMFHSHYSTVYNHTHKPSRFSKCMYSLEEQPKYDESLIRFQLYWLDENKSNKNEATQCKSLRIRVTERWKSTPIVPIKSAINLI